MSGRLLCCTDLHGAARALDQVLRRANFDPASDRLIFGGDVCDRGPEPAASMATLTDLGARRLWGNHDQWLWAWALEARFDMHEWATWMTQGGRATVAAFDRDPKRAKEAAAPYFAEIADYVHDTERDYVFVHGGIPTTSARTRSGAQYASLANLSRDFLVWDRSLHEAAMAEYAKKAYDPAHTSQLTEYRKVFIGHTPTQPHSNRPIEAGGVVLMDTGAGGGGPFSLMDVDSGKVWQSDPVADLYA